MDEWIFAQRDRRVRYLQCALLPGLLVEALQDFPVDAETQNPTGDFIVVRHCVALYLQFGINGQDGVRGVAARVPGNGRNPRWFRFLGGRLRLERSFLFFVSILKHIHAGF